MPAMLTSELFYQTLRGALNHFNDPDFLRRSPLVKLFNLVDAPDPATSLQVILKDAVNTLEIKDGDPARRQRYSTVLNYCYIQRKQEQYVAARLGLSLGHLHLEQNAAIEALAGFLSERYHLGAHPYRLPIVMKGQMQESAPPAQPGAINLTQTAPSPNELDWLRDLPAGEPVALSQVLPGALQLTQPLAMRCKVDFQVNLDFNLPGIAIQQVALRQILLNLLNVAITRQSAARLRVTGQAEGGNVRVEIINQGPGDSALPISDAEKASLEIAGRLAGYFKGRLELLPRREAFHAVLLLPAFHQRLVLVIDDSTDFLAQVERTLFGSRYLVAGERDPEQAIAAAEEVLPDIIMLDVRMPRVDGWDVLARVVNHSKTRDVPVIVCTAVSPEEATAEGIRARVAGASAYLRKPATQEQIMSTLERMSALLDQESI